jgi:hypothetical protein
MDDTAYCAYGCPPGKRCPVGDPNLGCLVGAELLHNPGRPRCCEVVDDDYFIDTVRAILAYGNRPEVVQQNAGTAGVRQALQNFLYDMNYGGAPDLPIFDGWLEIQPGQLSPNMIDDLVKLMHKVVPNSGFKVKMDVADIQRQPVTFRENPRNYFVSHDIPFPQLPSNALTIAAHVQVWDRNITGYKAVSLVLNALQNPNPSLPST